MLTRAIGAEGPPPELEKITGRAEPGDRFLLCSDGLFKALDSDAILPLLQGDDPARRLIDAALAAMARDNVTALVIEAIAPKVDHLASLDDLIGAGPPNPSADGDDDGTLMMRRS